MIKEKAVNTVKLSEVQKLLNENGIQYILAVEPSRRDFYTKKGFRPTEDTGAFYLISITNPHHCKNIEIIFTDDSNDSEFYDLEFGGYWYEMFGWMEEELSQGLIDEIHNIMSGKSWIIFATDVKTNIWFFDGLFCNTIEEEWNDMDRFYKTIEKIKKPKGLWRKLTGRTDCYEIFNWNSYEKIIK